MKWYKVKVYFPASRCMGITTGEEVHLDEIQGRDEKHALERARWNWPAANKVELI
jgi:hypothetical protein